MPDFSFLRDDDDDGEIRINTSRPKPAIRSLEKSAQSWDAVRTVMAWAILIAMFGGCYRWISNIPEQTDAEFAAADNSMLALGNAQSHIKTMLKSPSSARWPGVLSDRALRHVSRMKDGTYVVHSFVDSQNGFGAMIRTWYKVHLRVHKSGNPEILSSQIIE